MLKKLVALGIGLAVVVAPVASVSAQSYNGTTIPPESDGKTYDVTADSGDTVTLSQVGNGTLVVTFSSNVNGTMVIEEMASRPGDASSDAPGSVNTYFQVTLNGISNADIGSATWKFSVDKSFLNQHDATAANVFLHHFNGSEWERLQTSEVSANDTTVTFEAQVNSFSSFAVSVVPGLSNTGSPYMIGAIIGLATIVVVVAAFVLSRRQRQRA